MKPLKPSALCQAIRDENLQALEGLLLDPALVDTPGQLNATPRQWAHWVGNHKIDRALGIDEEPDMQFEESNTLITIHRRENIKKRFGFHYANSATFENPRVITKVVYYLRWLFQMSYFKDSCRWYNACYKDFLQKPRHRNSVVRYIDNIMGYGVFAQNRFHAGDVVGEYTGVINLRHLLSQIRDTTFVMAYPIPMPPGMRWSIDARRHGNFTRFINHAQQANTQVAVAYDNFIFRLLILANETIEPGQEITLDYGEDYWRHRYFQQQNQST